MELIPYKENSVLTTKKTKIRRLASSESGKIPTNKNHRPWFWRCTISGILVLTASFLIANYLPECEIHSILNSLHDNYEQQYNSIVQGNPEFCKQNLDIDRIFLDINQEVLNQKEALFKIQQLFVNETKFRGILIAGPPGVGKTHFGTQMMKNFIWKSNVQKYIFNNFDETDEENSHSELHQMLDNLSVCGENLIIVDNLNPNHIKEIENFRQKATEKVKQLENDERIVKLTVIFLVTIPNYNEVQKTEYNKKLEIVSGMETLDTVVFKSFGKKEILDCIHQIITKESLDIKDSEINEILNSIDPESGCKKVFVKTAVHSIF